MIVDLIDRQGLIQSTAEIADDLWNECKDMFERHADSYGWALNAYPDAGDLSVSAHPTTSSEVLVWIDTTYEQPED